MMRCPSCSNVRCRLSRPRWQFVPLLAVLMWPRRCPHCFRRYVRPMLWF